MSFRMEWEYLAENYQISLQQNLEVRVSEDMLQSSSYMC
jgi:hypothetical protein